MSDKSTILERVGLTKKEAEIYQCLLKLGESPVADIIKATKTHPQIIYCALEGLGEKGLVLTTYRRHRKYVRAEDPKVLEKNEEAKLKDLRSIMPDLIGLQKTSQDAVVRVLRGNEAIRSIRIRSIEELTEEGVQYIIGASGDRYYQIMGDLYKEIERKRIKKRIPKRLIAFESQRELLDKNDTLRANTEFRYLTENFHVPSSTNIFNDTVAISIWSEDPIMIVIESPQVAESYKHYFESLWQMAKE